MSEKIEKGPENPKRREFLKNIGIVAAATAGGFTGTPIVKRMFDKNQEQPQEQPKVLFPTPDKNDYCKRPSLLG